MADRAWLAIVCVGATLALTHWMLPAERVDTAYLAVAIGAAVVLWLAVASRRLARRVSWAFLAAGVTSGLVGDLIWVFYSARGIEPFPSLADVFYLGAYPLYATALWGLGRRERLADRAVLVDAGILGVAGLVLSWAYLLAPHVHDSELTSFERAVSVAYPVGDLLLLPVIARLVFVHAARVRPHLLVLFAMLVMLVADSAFGIGVLNETYVDGGPLDALWLVSYVLMAAAAWHPAAVDEPPALDVTGEVSRRRLLALAVATLLAPAVLLLHDPPNNSIGWVAGAASMLLFVLVVGRMAMLVDQVNLQARQLESLTRTDPLTGAANRRALDENLDAAIARLERDARPFAFALLDLDRFKLYNDTNGHLAGDALLRDAVARWATELREVDLLARYGGEEFAVLLPDADAGAARAAVERLRAAMPVGVTCSAGITIAEPGATQDDLVRAADHALYVAKASGRDQAVLATEASGHPDGAPVA
ncbi:diguanylate cyclase domain-containing protein [Egicoccus sp. AB-alg6-2]|uniref:GGDEF domain-containing protein n=1 Tax=Egicoccus sp. AB-alg6-2 TaxID=3242692 RepID=UPI00359E39FD